MAAPNNVFWVQEIRKCGRRIFDGCSIIFMNRDALLELWIVVSVKFCLVRFYDCVVVVKSCFHSITMQSGTKNNCFGCRN